MSLRPGAWLLDGEVERPGGGVGVGGDRLPLHEIFARSELRQRDGHRRAANLRVLLVDFPALGVEDLYLGEGGFEALGHPQLEVVRRGDGAADARAGVIEKRVGLRQRDAGQGV